MCAYISTSCSTNESTIYSGAYDFSNPITNRFSDGSTNFRSNQGTNKQAYTSIYFTK